MRGGVANAANAGDRRNRAQELSKATNMAVVMLAIIAIHILPKQRDFAHALARNMGNFGDDIIEWA